MVVDGLHVPVPVSPSVLVLMDEPESAIQVLVMRQ